MGLVLFGLDRVTLIGVIIIVRIKGQVHIIVKFIGVHEFKHIFDQFTRDLFAFLVAFVWLIEEHGTVHKSV